MATWPEIQAGIFAGESGGDYDALFGFSQRPGGQFANTKLTNMTVDQAIAFSDPNGPYANWVKSQVGRVATPMGAYQVVGNTLRQAKEWAGLSGNEVMSREVQDRIGQAILAKQGTGAWAGYKGPGQPGAPTSATAVATAQAPALGPNPYEDPEIDTTRRFQSRMADDLSRSVGRRGAGGGQQRVSAFDSEAALQPIALDFASATPAPAPPQPRPAAQGQPQGGLAELFKVKDIGGAAKVDPLTGQPALLRTRRV